MQMSEYVVELKNATKRFPGVVALKNMQLSVKPGEILIRSVRTRRQIYADQGADCTSGQRRRSDFVDGVEQHFRCWTRTIGSGWHRVRISELNIEKLSITDNTFIISGSRYLLDYPTMERAKEVMVSLGQDKI